MKAACTNYVVIAANTSLQDFTFTNSFDGYQNQTVTGLWVSPTTEHIQFNLVYKGRVIASVDCEAFNHLTAPMPVDVVIEAQQNAHLQFQDNTGTGVTSAAVTLFYDIPTRNA